MRAIEVRPEEETSEKNEKRSSVGTRNTASVAGKKLRSRLDLNTIRKGWKLYEQRMPTHIR